MTRPRILSVGQCSYDHGQIVHQIGKKLNAEIASADTHEEAIQVLRGAIFDLVLVNRVGDSDGASGLDLIRAIKADAATSAIPVMLVSNFDWAQNEAVALGAIPGFGKTDLNHGGVPASVEDALKPSRAV